MELDALAQRIRRYAIAGIYHARSGHPGGSLSCADILACLYGGEMKFDPAKPDDPARDRLVLSKGHACPALYGAAAAIGLIEPNDVATLRKLGSRLQGHPHVLDLPWTETSTGSLGQGFSAAIGMALGLRHQNSPARVYTILGDGEIQEGEVWEGAMSAAHYGLSNLCAIVDYNKMQSDDLNANIMGLEPLEKKFEAFGWQVLDVNGHDMAALARAFALARGEAARPTMIIAHTVKGRGVSFMEGAPLWHGSVTMSDDDTITSLRELGLSEAETGDWINGRLN